MLFAPSPTIRRTLALLASAALVAACGDPCTEAPDLSSRVRVHAPYPGLVPRFCGPDGNCRGPDHADGLAHSFEFEQRAEGTLWCSYEAPEGVFRTTGCADLELRLPEPESADRRVEVLVEGCPPRGQPPRVGEPCGVVAHAGVPRVDSCAPSLFCRAPDSTCRALPDGCELDVECNAVESCDSTGLCVRFACDAENAECVWPDECLDTTDCRRSHSRCDPRTGRCATFTCETGRCVGVGP